MQIGLYYCRCWAHEKCSSARSKWNYLRSLMILFRPRPLELTRWSMQLNHILRNLERILSPIVNNMGIFVFRGRGHGFFFRFTLKTFISIRMTLETIQDDYIDYVRHVWDIFGTIRPLKIIFWDYIFENFRLKMNKNTFFGLLWLYKGNYYLFKLRNEEFRCLRSEYMTIIIS